MACLEPYMLKHNVYGSRAATEVKVLLTLPMPCHDTPYALHRVPVCVRCACMSFPVQAEASAAGREMQRRYYSPVAYAVTKLVRT